MMKQCVLFMFAAAVVYSSVARGAEPATAPVVSAPSAESPEPVKKTFGHRLAMYLPNRIFDIFDIVRAKVGFGAGLAAGIRITDYADVWAGAQHTTWVGLPGPRREPKVSLPVGVDARAGAEVSFVSFVAEATESSQTYAPDEIGVMAHAVLAGAEVGVSIQEALDAVFGFLFIDIVGDDL